MRSGVLRAELKTAKFCCFRAMIVQNTLDFKLNALVCERAKVTWSEETLSHVSHFESTLKSQWISSDNLADLLDTIDANYDRFDKPKASAL